MSNENKDRHKETQAVRKVSHIKTIRSQRGEKERGGSGKKRSGDREDQSVERRQYRAG
jgi:hypothetical protein